MYNELDQKINLIINSVAELEQLTEFEAKLSKLDEVNNMIIEFLDQINNLPTDKFIEYNQHLNNITPKLEQFMNALIEEKQKLVSQIEMLNISKKALNLYEDA